MIAPELTLAPREVAARKDGDTWYLSSPLPLAEPPARLGDLLRRHAERSPERTFLIERGKGGKSGGERGGDELRRITYADALRSAEGIADWLINEQPRDARVLALSGNSVDHALLMLGCFLAGVPFVPVSPAYSLMSQDFAKLRTVVDKVRPTAIYVEAINPFQRAIDAIGAIGVTAKKGSVTLLVGGSERGGANAATSLGALFTRTVNRDALRDREATITPDHVAKILFTSGSTAFPKGVPNTHRMLCSNQQMIAQLWPFLSEGSEGSEVGKDPERGPLCSPVLVDWLPWSHTFGGNHNFNMVLFHGGTLFVDEGKPAEPLIHASLRNLREVAPTLYFNVPAGYAALVPHLERDEELRRSFFSRLRVMFYAAAALPPDLWTRLTTLAAQHASKRNAGAADDREVFMTTAWGSTETSPLATSMHFREKSAGNIGLPAPGVMLKILPNGKKLEVRVKGPHVMTGYLDEPELTKNAFDDEGFYRIGDAVRFASFDDQGNPIPSGGLLFDGRVAEDFKLSSGTWVSVTTIRTGIVARAAGTIADVVVCGQDRDALTLLVWPSIPGCRALLDEDKDSRMRSDEPVTLAHVARSSRVRDRIRDVIAGWNDANPASSTKIARVLLLTEPPSIDAGEITDKGYTNQRATLERRALDVARLYASPEMDGIIVIV